MDIVIQKVGIFMNPKIDDTEAVKKKLTTALKDLESCIDRYAKCKISKKQMYSILNSYDIMTITKYQSQIRLAEKLRTNTLQGRNLEVIYVYGDSGNGKTTLMKYFAKIFGFDYYISGTGKDLFDGYDMEELVVLDDFRCDMRFSELLKVLDNNTNSSVGSRYHNKDISRCKILGITAIGDPYSLYRNVLGAEGKANGVDEVAEPREQLFRRLKHHCFKVEDDGTISEMRLDASKEKPILIGKLNITINEVYKQLGIKKETSDNSIFDKFINPVKTEEDEEAYVFGDK